MTIVLFFLLLSVIITIHEAGHLLAAKFFKVYCYEFSFGMGPKLFSRKKAETEYCIRAVPMGGFVAMAGDPQDDEVYPGHKVPENMRLTSKKPWQKIIIMLAGVTMNFILAWVIFSGVMLSNGVVAMSPKAVVDSVVENSPAEKAGFEAGDVIIKVTKEDGSSIKPDTYLDMQLFSADNTGMEIYEVRRGDETVTISVVPEYNPEYDSYMIGITGPSSEIVKVNVLNCWYYGAYECRIIMTQMISVIRTLLRGIGLNNLSGPVGIYQATETYASLGFASYLLLIAQLSLNVGLFNLLPLPVLDGGQVVITLVEWITRRKLNQNVRAAIMLMCWVLLISLMLFATWNDISRLFA